MIKTTESLKDPWDYFYKGSKKKWVVQAIMQIYNKLYLFRHDASLLSNWLWNTIESQQSLKSLSYLYKKFLEDLIMTRKESDDLFLTPPYRYAFDLANYMFPEFDVDAETGEPFQCFSHVGFDAFRAIQEDKCDFPFKKKDYDVDADIQKDLARLYFDPEAFWHALLMLHFLTQDKMVRAYKLGPSQKETVNSALKALDSEGSTIIIRKGNGRTFKIDDNDIVSYIRASLESSPFLYGMEMREVDESQRYTCSYSEMISFEAKGLLDFFEVKSKPEFEKRGKKYRKPLLLISRLMYFTGLTDNETYLVESDTLEGIMKSYPHPGQRTVGKFNL